MRFAICLVSNWISRLSGDRRLITTCFSFLNVLFVFSSQGQPAVVWQKQLGSRQFGENFEQVLPLASNRFLTVGSKDTTQSPQNTYTVSYAFFLTGGQGDSISTILRHPALWNYRGAACLGEHGTFYMSGFLETNNVLLDGKTYMWQFDTLGHERWRVRVDTDSPRSLTTIANALHSIPGGVVATAYRGVYGYGGKQALVTRFDQHGRQQWQRKFGYRAKGVCTVPALDGSYWVVINDYLRNYTSLPNPPGSSNGTYYGQDVRLIRVSATGDSLAAVWWGEYLTYEEAVTAKATTDGGLIFTARWANPPSTTYAGGVLVKVDSAGHEQWRYTWPRPPGTGSSPAYQVGSELYDVQELANGQFVVCGKAYISLRGQTEYYVGAIAPPDSSSAQAYEVWHWYVPYLVNSGRRYGAGLPMQLIFDGDSLGTLRIFGQGFGTTPTFNYNLYQALLRGAGQPAVIDYCRRRPSQPLVSMSGILPGDSVTFAVDSLAQTTGTTHGEISLVEWDFGDGSPLGEGWTVTHHYASPVPVCVKLRVCSNLGCCRDTVLYPLGPGPCRVLTGLPVTSSSQVSVYPNPSTSGHFTVQGAEGATWTILDALGRQVLTTSSPAGSDALLDLRSQPTGVYTLQLRWPDGRTTTRKLMRW